MPVISPPFRASAPSGRDRTRRAKILALDEFLSPPRASEILLESLITDTILSIPTCEFGSHPPKELRERFCQCAPPAFGYSIKMRRILAAGRQFRKTGCALHPGAGLPIVGPCSLGEKTRQTEAEICGKRLQKGLVKRAQVSKPLRLFVAERRCRFLRQESLQFIVRATTVLAAISSPAA
jgi:hypothetical protein